MVKVYITYPECTFGIEVDTDLAAKMISAWLNKSSEEMEVEGYGFYPNEAVKLELFDLV